MMVVLTGHLQFVSNYIRVVFRLFDESLHNLVFVFVQFSMSFS